MKTKYADRLEKVRKARSLNDVISIVKDIAKDVVGHKKIITKGMTATAATKPTEETLEIDHGGHGPSKLPKKPKKKYGTKPQKPAGAGVKVEEFVAPPVKKIKEQSSLIHDLEENFHSLEAAEAMIKQAFSRATKQATALKGIQALKDEVQGMLDKAYELLQDISLKHLPDQLQELNQSLFDFMIEQIPQTKYEDITQHIFVTMHETDQPAGEAKAKGPSKIKIASEFSFHCYNVVHNLKTSSDWKFPQYVMALTGVVDKNMKMRFYLNALPDFKAPGKAPLGAEVNDADDLVRRAMLLLAHNDVVTEFDQKPMPLTTQEAEHRGFHRIAGVKSAKVVADELRITVLPGKATQANLQKIELEVRSLLQGVVGNLKRKRTVIMPKVAKNKAGETVIRFRLIPDLPSSGEKQQYHLNVSKLREMQEILDLPDDVAEQIKKVLKEHV